MCRVTSGVRSASTCDTIHGANPAAGSSISQQREGEGEKNRTEEGEEELAEERSFGEFPDYLPNVYFGSGGRFRPNWQLKIT